MQAILLLAGKNSRFFPFNKDFHKGMVMLRGKPLLHYMIDSLKEAGIDDIIIVTGSHGDKIKQYFTSVNNLDVTITYAQQEVPAGQGDALLKAKHLIKDSFLIVNPYHTEEAGLLKQIIQAFEQKQIDGIIPGIYEKNIHNYGAIILDNGQVKGIVEKPLPGEEPSHYRATSAYIFKPTFLEYLAREPLAEYSFEAAITKYAQEKHVEMFEIDSNYKTDSLKYPWHILHIHYKLGTKQRGYISPHAHVSDSAVLDDTVYIDDGAYIYPGACITGHTYIGKNTKVGNYSVVRDSDLGDNVQVGIYSDITRSVIMEGTHSHGGGFIGDSIIGKNCRLASGFTTANKRIDRTIISTFVKGQKVSTGLDSLGAIFGSNVKMGINVSTMPGVIVGSNSTIGAGVIVYKNLHEHSKLLLKQVQELTEEIK